MRSTLAMTVFWVLCRVATTVTSGTVVCRPGRVALPPGLVFLRGRRRPRRHLRRHRHPHLQRAQALTERDRLSSGSAPIAVPNWQRTSSCPGIGVRGSCSIGFGVTRLTAIATRTEAHESNERERVAAARADNAEATVLNDRYGRQHLEAENPPEIRWTHLTQAGFGARGR
jgi:hypothetical protein